MSFNLQTKIPDMTATVIQENLNLINRIISCYSGQTKDTDFIIQMSKCPDKMVMGNIIRRQFDEHIVRLSSEYEKCVSLEQVFGWVANFMQVSQASIRARISEYDAKYSYFCRTVDKNNDVDVESYKRAMKVHPSRVFGSLDQLFSKVNEEIKKSQVNVSGQFEDSEQFANFLLPVFTYARATASFVAICDIAFEKFKDGQTEEFKNLMAEISTNPHFEKGRDTMVVAGSTVAVGALATLLFCFIR
ncbi:hypothetical protein H4219_006112 [Mycoemilia scoparia]|uniref:Uncharacterized protein n=1 Tax=Mycoemilia scoparia TaxID=417184 RepID=A0A9W7ZQT6_9FUNG|nr:hypothetical protein H4219_006112 [Mycoemilia scoparia]